jgi:hypothetical protein
MSIIKDLHRVICDIEDLQDQYCKSDARRTAAEVDLDEALDVLCNCAYQFLMGDDKDPQLIRHSFMSTEEHLCAFLVAHGRMEAVSRGVFRMLPNDKISGPANQPAVSEKTNDAGSAASTC